MRTWIVSRLSDFALNTRKKQTSFSHSSTEAEVTSLDASLRMDGIPALDLWDFVIEAFHSEPNQTKPNQHNQSCKRTTEKLVVKSSTKHAETNSNHEHQSRSIRRNTFCFQCCAVCLWFHGSTELLWIGCLTRRIWTHKFKSVTLTPHTNSQTC